MSDGVSARSRRMHLLDVLAGLVIRGGGVLVIAAVAGIFLFIGRVVLPLFGEGRATLVREGSLPSGVASGRIWAAGTDEYETYAYVLSDLAAIHLVRCDGWSVDTNLPIPELAAHGLSAAYRGPQKEHLYLGTRDGHVLSAQVKFQASYAQAGRSLTASVSVGKPVRVSEAGSEVTRIFGRQDSSGGKAQIAVATKDGKLYHAVLEDGEDPKVEELGGERAGPLGLLAVDGDGRKLFAALGDDVLLYYDLEKSTEQPAARYGLGKGRRLTAMEWLVGGNSLLLGFDNGVLEQWFGVRSHPGDENRTFRRIRGFEPMDGPVTALAPSGRDRGFLAGSGSGQVRVYFSTSEKTVATMRMQGGGVEQVVYSPKLTSVLALGKGGSSALWELRNPHPEISLRTLFGKVWYEGYDRPDYVWQSTGGSDDFESKFSLVPLIVGTLKGAFYGLFFAIPVAVLAALYASQFMSPRLKAVVKPAVEIMAALPSVVVGFLAGLWLAPVMEDRVCGLAAALLVVPILVLIGVSLWHQMPLKVRLKIPHGMELALLVPVVALGSWIGLAMGPSIEQVLFHGDLRQSVFDIFGQQFEQRNSIVIGFAMGFAVIPIIFTISDDALSNVPRHFVSGSLALGASRWQTATRIILPTASPGIFSAIMVGFGRAVGETMIVLMATGNTPIMNLSPFNGMRTLSANIAVEIPEAPVDGTLYRVLFFTAILLFLMTFLVNTVAEAIRLRLRQKYSAV